MRPLVLRVGEVYAQASTCEQRDEPTLCALREAIIDFQRRAATAELTA